MDENSIARRLLRLQGEHDRLKEDFVFLYGYHEQETRSIWDEASHTQGVLEADFARLARENLEEAATLRERNDDLESQLRYAQSQISALEQRVRDKRFDADGLLVFLNAGSNEVRGNWPRFRKLLGQFQRGAAAPPFWKTWITVEAADKSFRMIPPYPGPAPPDSDENDDDAEQEEKSEDNPPSPDPKRDTPRGKKPRGKEPRKSQSGSKRQASSQHNVDIEVQCRPTVNPESDVGPRSASEALPFTIRDACALLPEFIAWEDLRPDVQWAMRTDLGYDEAVEVMLAAATQHALFHRDSLCDMLATMMYRHKLDDTLWAKYVPTAYYVMAEVILESWLERGVVPPEWPELHNLTEDRASVSDSSSSEEGDDPEDLDFAGPSPKEEEVDPPQASPDNAETSPPDSDALVLRSKRKVPVQRVYSSSDSSGSSVEATTKTLVYTPSPKRPRHSRAGTKSGKKSGGLRARARSSLDRIRSFLARNSYDELSPTEMAMIEVPDPNILSWRRRGILTQYTPRKGDHEYQTPGFPDYSPQKTEIRYLAQRWTPFEGAYIAFRAKKPWKTMFRSRVKELYFHRRADLDAKVWEMLDEYLEYVRDHAEAFWEVLHWFTIKYKPGRDEEDDDLDKYSVSTKLYRERAARHESVGRSMEARIRKYTSKGVPASLFEEPGVWKYSVKICHLYLADESTLNAAGKPFSLEEQITLAEQAEPSRTQWTKYCTDAEWIAHVVPKELQQKLLPPDERKKNPGSLTL
ncbi:hypothetical protein PF011_g29143 [Phytophthora fragariae]|uniref:Uncharacterized protein n=1 Tax=Phytophthora fragariae TaxID=53985 RepID=A0A6A3H272_9STRA|nr:hypothetical protein PF011_g29143 [Phytophthora fragariae]